MDRVLFIKFLKYLHTQSEYISKKDIIDKFEIDSLKKDLAKLQHQLTTAKCSELDSTLVESVVKLNLNIHEAHLEGDKRNFWHSLIKRLFVGSPAGMALQQKNTEIIAKDLIDFRNKISHILFALEI